MDGRVPYKRLSLFLLIALPLISCQTSAESEPEFAVTEPIVPPSTNVPAPSQTATHTPTAETIETATPTPMPLATVSGELISGYGSKEVTLEFINFSSEAIRIFWVDSLREEFPYGQVNSQSTSSQGTYSTHAWRLVDEGGNVIAEFLATNEDVQVYEIRADKQVFTYPFIPSTPVVETVYQPYSQCNLPNVMNYDGVSLAFPRFADRLPSTGTVKVIVLFAEFPDVKTLMSPEEAFGLVSPGTEEFFRTVSYGRMDVQLEPHFAWLPMSQPSTYYAESIKDGSTQRDMLQEGIDLSDSEVDFSGADEVLLISNPRASAIPIGPTWIGTRDSPFNNLQADGARIVNGITSGFDLSYWGFLWLPHEMGHSMGLVDLYSFDGKPGFTGPFSLMNDIGGKAPEYLAYERWLLDWLDNDQIICQEANNQTTTLSPIETAGGIKAVMVPLSDSRLVAIESRRALGYDAELTTPGVLVYTVDTAVQTGNGPIVVENNKIPLTAGGSLTIENVTITVLESTDGGDTVQVTIAE